MSPFCHDGIGAAIENWEYGENVNFVSSIDGYARMRIFFLAQVSGLVLFQRFLTLFSLDRLLTTLFPILFLLILDEVRDFTFFQNSWQSIL